MKAKKLLAALLAVTMLLGMMSFPAFAEGSEVGTVPVASLEDLDAAISRAVAGDVIELTQDIEITDTYTIDTTVPITINFGDYTIDATKVDIEKDSVVIAEGADVTFTAGTGGIKGNKNCLTNYGGTVTLNGGAYSTKLIGRGSALYNGSGTMEVNDGVTVDAWKFALYNEKGATCNLKGGNIESHAHNGLKPEASGQVGYAYAVFNAGTMNMYDGAHIRGIQGGLTTTSGGVTNIYGGSIETHEDDEGSEGKSFYACYAAANGDLTIWEGTFTAARRAAVYVGNEDVGLDGARIQIKGGTFVSKNGAAAAIIQEKINGALSITGGSFSSDVSKYCPEDFVAQPEGDGTFTIAEKAFLYNERYYSTLQQAVDAAAVAGEESAVITMLKDMEGDGVVIENVDNLTIDFGGHTYNVTGKLVGSSGTETQAFQLLSKGREHNYAAPNITFKNGTITSTNAVMLIQNYSNLKLENMTLDGTKSVRMQYVLSNNNGNTVLTGDTNIEAPSYAVAFDVWYGMNPYPAVTVTLDENMTGTVTGKIEIGGQKVAETPEDHQLTILSGTIDGTIEKSSAAIVEGAGNVQGGTFTKPVDPEFCAEGMSAIPDADGNYSIQKLESMIVKFEPVKNAAGLYDIVLMSNTKNPINRLTAAELAFAIESDTVAYEILPYGNISLVPNTETVAENDYLFHLDGVTAPDETAHEITIGQVQLGGYGDVKFSIDDGAANAVRATATENSIVTDYLPSGGTAENVGLLIINDAGNNGVIDTTIKPATQKLTLRIAFPNAVENQAKAYQDMKVSVSGGHLAEALTYELGSDSEDCDFEAIALGDKSYDGYIIEVADTLLQNTAYTVTIEGKGYRTARYTVNMQEADKELTFWNNVMDTATVIETGNADSAATVTYLAGDIVKDNNINIYDLSAVVSYFGTVNNVAEKSDYAKYDLNRDGKIDSKDVAMVLVSWGN